MHLKVWSLFSFGAVLAIAATAVHANSSVNRPDLFAGATLISAIRTELGTPRLDAVSRTLEINRTGYRIEESSLGRVLCGAVELTPPGASAYTVGEGESLAVAAGTVVRAIESRARIVTVSVVPKFDGLVP